MRQAPRTEIRDAFLRECRPSDGSGCERSALQSQLQGFRELFLAEGFLQHRPLLPGRVETAVRVACREHERYAALVQRFRDRIAFLTAEIDVEDGNSGRGPAQHLDRRLDARG